MQVYGQLEKAQLENVAGNLGNSLAGLLWFDTVATRAKMYDGGAIRTLVDENSTQTLTGKTLTGNVLASFTPNGVNTVTVPAATGVLVTDTFAQTLTNKTITGGVFDVVTLTHQTTPVAPAAGRAQLYFKNDNLLYGQNSSGTEFPIGSGSGGGLDVFHSEPFITTKAVDFSSGNSSTFLGGGALAGTLANETVAPLSGVLSIKYTQAAGSLNDYVVSPVVSVPVAARGTTVGIKFPYLYNGAATDLKVVIYDVTNAQVLSSNLDLLEVASTAKSFQTSVFIPATCTQIRYGFHVVAVNSGKILYFDNVELSTNPFAYKNITDRQYVTNLSTLTDGTGGIRFNLAGGTHSNTGQMILSVADDAANSRTNFTATRECTVSISFSATILSNGTILTLVKNGTTIYSSDSVNSAQAAAELSTQVRLIAGDVLYLSTNLAVSTATPFLHITAEAANESVVTPNTSFSTDSTPLVYASSSQYTEATLPNAPVGTFITFTHAASSATETQTTTAPTQTVAQMATQGIAVAGRNFTQATTAGAPAYFAIQVGKGLKAAQVMGFSGTTKSTTASLDFCRDGTTELGMLVKEYSPITGILKLNLGRRQTGTNTDHFVFDANANGTNPVYIVANASANAAMSAVPVQQTAILKDVKAQNTAGGTFTASAWQTRTLNTTEGATSFVSLASNQFTLEAGEYIIEASAPGYRVANHMTRLRNITDSTTDSVGTAEWALRSDSGSDSIDGVTRSFLLARLTLSSTKVFEIQHFSGATVATNGFGYPCNFASTSEVYTIVKITKVR